MNFATMIGRPTNKPIVRTAGDSRVANFTIAVDRDYKNRSGEREADFIPVVVWGKPAELCEQYLDKGNLVALSGRIQVRSYEVADGSKRYITELVADRVQFLTPKPKPSGEPTVLVGGVIPAIEMKEAGGR